MAARPQPHAARGTEELPRAEADEALARGPEAHHDDVGARCHAQPLKGLFATGTVASLAGALSTSVVGGSNGARTCALS